MTNDKINLDQLFDSCELPQTYKIPGDLHSRTTYNEGFDDGAYQQLQAIKKQTKKQIQELIVEAQEETAKAYGGCTKCYGKGYATVRKGRSYRKSGIYKTWEMNEEMNYCTCDRGRQLAQLQDSPRKSTKGQSLDSMRTGEVDK